VLHWFVNVYINTKSTFPLLEKVEQIVTNPLLEKVEQNFTKILK
jgi:hypothetical protein